MADSIRFSPKKDYRISLRESYLDDMRKPLRPHREEPTIVGRVSEVILI